MSIYKFKEEKESSPYILLKAYSLQRNMVLIILNIRKVMEIYKGGLYDEKE